jgi:hypothetical protein
MYMHLRGRPREKLRRVDVLRVRHDQGERASDELAYSSQPELFSTITESLGRVSSSVKQEVAEPRIWRWETGRFLNLAATWAEWATSSTRNAIRIAGNSPPAPVGPAGPWAGPAAMRHGGRSVRPIRRDPHRAVEPGSCRIEGATRRETGWGEPLGWDRMRLSGLRSGRRDEHRDRSGPSVSHEPSAAADIRKQAFDQSASGRFSVTHSGSSVGRNDGRFAMTRLFCGVGSPSGLFVGSPSIGGGDLRKFLICVHEIQNLRHSYSR